MIYTYVAGSTSLDRSFMVLVDNLNSRWKLRSHRWFWVGLRGVTLIHFGDLRVKEESQGVYDAVRLRSSLSLTVVAFARIFAARSVADAQAQGGKQVAWDPWTWSFTSLLEGLTNVSSGKAIEDSRSLFLMILSQFLTSEGLVQSSFFGSSAWSAKGS